MPKRKEKKATIVDVASLAGVSIKTVSRVINREANVRAGTQEKVLEAVSKLNYRPNSAARTLSAKRSFVIGLVYENPEEFSYIKAVLDGVLDACEQEGYTPVLRPMSLADVDLSEHIRDLILQTQMDGVILPAPIGDIPEVRDLLDRLELPCALISPRSCPSGGIAIEVNDEQASYEVTEYLISLGHRRIGFIKGDPDHSSAKERYDGYRRALSTHGIRYERSLVRAGRFNFESGQKAGAKLLSLTPIPTAIIASNDDMAAGVMFEAHERGVSIPRELSVVGFDDTSYAQRIWPPLTTVRQPLDEMGHAAAELLIRKVRGEEVSSPSESFKCELVVRSSTRSI